MSAPFMPPADARLGPVGRVRLAAEVLAAYPRVRWMLWRRTLPEALGEIRAGARPPALAGPAVVGGVRLGHVVGRTLAPLPLDGRCLVKSLVLGRLLARRGVPFTLVIGVGVESEFDAHAWIEHQGRPLLPDGAPRFRRLAEL